MVVSERSKILAATNTYIIAEAVINVLFDDDSDDDDDCMSMMLSDDDMVSDALINTKKYESDDEDSYDDFITSPETLNAIISSFRYMESKAGRLIPKSNYLIEVVFSLPEKQFKQDARMSYKAFKAIYDMISPDPVFKNNSRNPQAPVHHQLLIALYRLGMFGNAASASQIAGRFGVGDGTADLYTFRVIRAMLRFYKHLVYWPKPHEKEAIKAANEEISGFPNCIGYIDGTGIVLAEAPIICEEDYYTRKSEYALAAMVVGDHNLRIRFMDVGFVGSVHDTRVWHNSKLSQNIEEYFKDGEYILGDKGYPVSKQLITPYKEPHASIPKNAAFNYFLSKPRVRIEHTIGVLKGRFQSLRGLRISIGKGKDPKKDQARAAFWINTCVLLHNFLIEDGNPLDDWMHDNQDGGNTNAENNQEAAEDNMFSSGDEKRTHLKDIVLECNGFFEN